MYSNDNARSLLKKILDFPSQKSTEIRLLVKLIAEAVLSYKKQFLKDLEQALYASKIIFYAQGFILMQEVRVPITEDVDIY